MHKIKQRQPQYAGRTTLFVEIAGQAQGLPPLLDAEPGQYLAVLTEVEAFEMGIIRRQREINNEMWLAMLICYAMPTAKRNGGL